MLLLQQCSCWLTEFAGQCAQAELEFVAMSRASPLFRFTTAIVRDIHPQLPTRALRQNTTGPDVCLQTALRQHALYEQALQRCGLEVHRIATTKCDSPDAVFVEDTAVFIQHLEEILITNPGAVARRSEVSAMEGLLLHRYGNVYSSMDPKGDATLDGGDVLFTGREYIVGVGSRTNTKGMLQLAAAVANSPHRVVPVDISGWPSLHLKSFCSVIGDAHVLVGGLEGERLQDTLEKTSPMTYKFSRVPDSAAANVLLVNGTIIRRSDDEFPASASFFSGLLDAEHLQLDMSELQKVDGALTCCSVLFRQ